MPGKGLNLWGATSQDKRDRFPDYACSKGTVKKERWGPQKGLRSRSRYLRKMERKTEANELNAARQAFLPEKRDRSRDAPGGDFVGTKAAG